MSSAYRLGSGMMNETLCRVAMRSWAPYSTPTFHAQSTVRSMMNATIAIAAPRIVMLVRKRLRRRFFTAKRMRRNIGGLLELSLVQAPRDRRALGRGRVVRHHQDRLVEVDVELREEVEDVVSALPVEI